MPEITPAQPRVQRHQHHFAHIHPSVAAKRVAEAVERELTTLDNPSRRKPGSSLACGAEADGCEPDAGQCPCESCGAPAVYGAGEILIAIA